MDAKEFIIKKFEQNNPELLKVIEDWTQHSINQNWDELRILLNEINVPNCPKANEYDKELKINKQYHFLQKVSENIADYLLAKGFTYIETISDYSSIAPDGRFYRGCCIFASMKKIPKTYYHEKN